LIGHRQLHITLVCEVLDNFGDAGITWRLACLLADEWHARITIAIDQPALLQLWHQKRRDRQPCDIKVTKLQDARTTDQPPDLLIAMLGSTVPPAIRAQILAHRVSWVRYEYLTAEPWIDEFHGRSSVKPDDGATEWFYYPGYTSLSGGLLREKNLLAQLRRFTSADPAASGNRSAWMQANKLDSPADHFRVCLFGYAEPSTHHLLESLLALPRPISIFIAQSLAGGLALDTSDPRLRVHQWLDQPDFDCLLASCDLSIVRGEDSWLRAQWTGQPMFWQPYRQADAGHLNKLAAFLDRLLAGAEPGAARAIRQAMMCLNDGSDGRDWPNALPAWFDHLSQIRQIHRAWRDELALQTTLGERLLSFSRDQLQLSV